MSAAPTKVLVIEDETQIRRFLRPAMEAVGHRLVEAATAGQGILEAAQCNPDIIILDLGLPDADGLEVVRRVREWSRVPIIILSARGQEGDKVAALDAGADDYLTKPFSVSELMARIRVALRHASTTGAATAATTVSFGAITLDLARREVRRKGELVHLTPIEYKLLSVLVRHAGLVVTQRQLLKEVWGPGHAEENHYLRIFVRQLREKLEENPSRPVYLITEAGVGYRLRTELESGA